MPNNRKLKNGEHAGATFPGHEDNLHNGRRTVDITHQHFTIYKHIHSCIPCCALPPSFVAMHLPTDHECDVLDKVNKKIKEKSNFTW